MQILGTVWKWLTSSSVRISEREKTLRDILESLLEKKPQMLVAELSTEEINGRPKERNRRYKVLEWIVVYEDKYNPLLRSWGQSIAICRPDAINPDFTLRFLDGAVIGVFHPERSLSQSESQIAKGIFRLLCP